MLCFNAATDKILIGDYGSSVCELMIVDTTGNPRRDYVLESFDFFSRREAQEFADRLKAHGRVLEPTNIRHRKGKLCRACG